MNMKRSTARRAATLEERAGAADVGRMDFLLAGERQRRRAMDDHSIPFIARSTAAGSRMSASHDLDGVPLRIVEGRDIHRSHLVSVGQQPPAQIDAEKARAAGHQYRWLHERAAYDMAIVQ